ncbi:Hypothetical predicted protein [Paramuricea clavata]|uniref:Uncharacterized protein n=1 Tax=Paramuricea clavata TaxID=317549 RepID=A0A6S7IJX8_PARCT|nr:Hypothetical predicted protein [Paramuricea clavata]
MAELRPTRRSPINTDGRGDSYRKQQTASSHLKRPLCSRNPHTIYSPDAKNGNTHVNPRKFCPQDLYTKQWRQMEKIILANITIQAKVDNRRSKSPSGRSGPPPMQRIAEKRLAASSRLEDPKQRG